MSRQTKKLTRADRDKRSAKRERRAEGQEQRQLDRQVRERWQKIPRAVRARFSQIAEMYERATLMPVVSEVVCESCGFAQPYGANDEDALPKNEHGNVICLRGPALGLPCDGEYAITVERFSGS